jgi:replication factor C subunit 3/5
MYFYFEVLQNWFQVGCRSIDLELTTLSSANHIEMTPGDADFQDIYIVQEIIKEIAKNGH